MKGADVNATDKFFKTPLHLATTFECLKTLIDYGANIKKKDMDRKTPLETIKNKNIRRSIKKYIEDSLDIKQPDE